MLNLPLVKLMELFNHSSVAITKRYLGLRQEEILQTYDCFELLNELGQDLLRYIFIGSEWFCPKSMKY